MSALVQEANVSTIEDLSLDDALDERAGIIAFIDANAPKIMAARKALAEIDLLIQLRMEETGARRFERGRFRGTFVKKKSGSASVNAPAVLKANLEQLGGIPQAVLDEAMPLIDVEPVIKPDLRKVRKLAEYGTAYSHLLAVHITEPKEIEELVIEPIVETKNVTGSATEALT